MKHEDMPFEQLELPRKELSCRFESRYRVYKTDGSMAYVVAETALEALQAGGGVDIVTRIERDSIEANSVLEADAWVKQEEAAVDEKPPEIATSEEAPAAKAEEPPPAKTEEPPAAAAAEAPLSNEEVEKLVSGQ